MQKLEYNGWTNYETWNYKLWLDNDEKGYNLIQSLVKSVIKTEREKNQVFKMSEMLKMECLNNEPNLKPSFYSDVLSASLKEVNFYEIAEAYINDYKEEHQEWEEHYKKAKKKTKIDEAIIREAKHLGKLIDEVS